MDWLRSVEHLREHRRPGVLVTLVAVRGHAPREAGAKMAVTADQAWVRSVAGTSRRSPSPAPACSSRRNSGRPRHFPCPSPKASAEYGVHAAAARWLLLEPLPVPPAVAVFGMGHVGLELARILARLDLDLHLVDTRPDQLSPERLAVLGGRAGARPRAPRRAGAPESLSRSCRREPMC